MKPLPDGWRLTKLGQVLTLQSNGKLVQQGWSPRCHTRPAEEGEWGVLKTTSIQAGSFHDTHHKALPDELRARPAIEVQPGDLLITCAGPRARCGVPALVRTTRPRLMMSGKMYRLRPTEVLDARYLEAWLLSPVAQKLIDQMKTGISDSGLNLTHGRFLELPVPVPPLVEQLRIVDVLDGHLSRLDAASASLANGRARCVTWEEAWLQTRLSSAPSDELTTVGSALTECRGGWSRSRQHLASRFHVVGVEYGA